MEYKFLPIYRDFGNNFVAMIGRQVVEFLYPPLLIKDIHKVETKLKLLSFAIGLTVFMILVLATMVAILRINMYRKRELLRQITEQLINIQQNLDHMELGNIQPIRVPMRLANIHVILGLMHLRNIQQIPEPMPLVNIEPNPGPIPAPVGPNRRRLYILKRRFVR